MIDLWFAAAPNAAATFRSRRWHAARCFVLLAVHPAANNLSDGLTTGQSRNDWLAASQRPDSESSMKWGQTLVGALASFLPKHPDPQTTGVATCCARELESRAMRSHYATHKTIRLFVLGVPEGWHVKLFDLGRRQWIENTASMESTLKEAKSVAQERAAAIVGRKLPESTWH
jgi:hypothetical protein